MVVMQIISSVSGLIASIIEGIGYMGAVFIWKPLLFFVTRFLQLSTPISEGCLNSGVGSMADGVCNWSLQTFLVPFIVGVERPIMPYVVDLLEWLFNLLM